ncbi:sulfotransferase family 2 domain-containing protein [Neogemmobacter tilapiae]|uniref:Type II secretory pathway, pullulanase PulA n=1 Tax=Neogemmobacter tilapiae TaxID=875041 RepID=A0A918TW96_9RHOB|nr:sulfotransferase family 2 domain-containing protein [Gemmobacter tilapiae]GHC65690.1 hypothetical protein GCM10007315_32790 [Gemmobacter tilapiae]
MILSRGRKYLFLHVPKTGGTALTLALEARAMKDDIIVGDTPKARARAARQKHLQTKGRLWKHSTLADLDGLVSPNDDLFLVTLVRNPWDRVVSLYHWAKTQPFSHPLIKLAKTQDFSGFLNAPLTADLLARNPLRKHLTDSTGQQRPALIARLEQPQDLAPFETHLGFALLPLPRANESARPRDWRGYYTDADAALLARLCAEDIARFGYTFDG